MAASGGSFSSMVGPPRLTYPTTSASSEVPSDMPGLPTEDAEVDILPFALDADAMPPSPHPPVPLRASLLSPSGDACSCGVGLHFCSL